MTMTLSQRIKAARAARVETSNAAAVETCRCGCGLQLLPAGEAVELRRRR